MRRPVWIALAAVLALVVGVVVFARQHENREPLLAQNTESTGGGLDASGRPLELGHPSKSAAPTPKPTPPAPATITIPTGTAMNIRLGTEISTRSSQVGDAWNGTLNEPVMAGGQVAIPAGAAVSGHVAMIRQPGRTTGRALLQLSYDRVSFGGRSYDLGTRGRELMGGSGRGTDAGLIAGGAVAGGILGGIIGHGGGDVAKGAIIGGTAGGIAAATKRGPQLTLPVGTTLTVSLDQPLTVQKPRAV